MNEREKFSLPLRYKDHGESVWTEYVKLANEYNPVNLGQGFPDFPPPEYVTDALCEVANNPDKSVHQYTRGQGHPRLIMALSKLYSRLINREVNPYTEIVTTLGAYNAVYATIMGHIDNGDEVILMEPFFECYEHNIKAAGGIPKFIPLKLKEKVDGFHTSADWILDQTELENLFNRKTKAIIINTPHNPLGKVFSFEELNVISELCKKWNVLCISDEVYQWLVYGPKHIRIASLPGMWDRTITIGSAGKTFGVTGWKLGWAYGASHLIHNVQLVHHNSLRAGNTVLQEAAAICFEKELSRLGQDDCYLTSFAKELVLKRDFLFNSLLNVGMKPILPEGGYFIVADWSNLEKFVDLDSEKDEFKDYRFTKWMTKNVGVQGIPTSAFYKQEDKHIGEKFARFCFVKTDECLESADAALKKFKQQIIYSNK